MKKNKEILKNELKVLTLWNTETYKVIQSINIVLEQG